VDGHDTAALDDALSAARDDPRPAVVIARTSTTHGLSVLPDGADGHFIKLPARSPRRPSGNWRPVLLKQPYPTVTKPCGRALVDLARERTEILCLTGDLTRQTEIDLLRCSIVHADGASGDSLRRVAALRDRRCDAAACRTLTRSSAPRATCATSGATSLSSAAG
jgi:rRNA-processing protein FCF1